MFADTMNRYSNARKISIWETAFCPTYLGAKKKSNCEQRIVIGQFTANSLLFTVPERTMESHEACNGFIVERFDEIIRCSRMGIPKHSLINSLFSYKQDTSAE